MRLSRFNLRFRVAFGLVGVLLAVLAAPMQLALAQDEEKRSDGTRVIVGEVEDSADVGQRRAPDGRRRGFDAGSGDAGRDAFRGDRKRIGPIIRIGSDATVEEDEDAEVLVVVGGNALVKGSVSGPVVTVFGGSKILGRVRQEVVAVMGGIELGETAEVRHDVVSVGGKISSKPGAKFGAGRSVFSLPVGDMDFDWASKYFQRCVLRVRPLAPEVRWTVVTAVLLLGIHAFLALLFPRPVGSCVRVLEAQPVGVFFSGILAFPLFLAFVVALLISVVGALVVPFAIIGFTASLVFGKAALFRYLGEQFGRQVGLVRLAQSPLLALVVGGLLVIVVYMVPVLGLLVWGALLPFALGAVVMAVFQAIRQDREAATPQGVGMAPMPPVMGTSVEPGAEVTYRRAGFWRRGIATALDFLLLSWLGIFIGPFALVAWVLYHVVMWRWKNTTIGGIVLGIKVIRLDGRQVDFATALVRGLSSVFSGLVFCLGFFWAGWDAQKQSWHDKIAGTTMVVVPRGVSLV